MMDDDYEMADYDSGDDDSMSSSSEGSPRGRGGMFSHPLQRMMSLGQSTSFLEADDMDSPESDVEPRQPFRSSLSPCSPPVNLQAAAAAVRSRGNGAGLFSSPETGSPMSYMDSPTSAQLSAVSTPAPASADRSACSSSSSRPVPDMSAFDNPTDTSRTHTPQRKAPPPTPTRTPVLSRHDTLNANRTLVEQDSDTEGESSPAPKAVEFDLDFENMGQIGAGSFSLVYKARSLSDNQVYAVKRSLKPLHSRKDRENYLNEIRVTQAVGHNPNIIRYKRAWQEGGFLYQQVELCPRGSLSYLLETKPQGTPVPTEVIYCVIADVASALAAIHAAGYAHLDIKPDNLFISQSGHIKVGDFGLARSLTSSDDGVEGDNRYMAKELLNAGGLAPAADIFSLGMTALELAWDWPVPKEGPGWQALRNGIMPPLPSHIDRPELLIACITQMLHPVPAQRPTAQAIFDHPTIRAAHGAVHTHLIKVPTDATNPEALRAAEEGRTFGRSSSCAVDAPTLGRSGSFNPGMVAGLGRSDSVTGLGISRHGRSGSFNASMAPTFLGRSDSFTPSLPAQPPAAPTPAPTNTPSLSLKRSGTIMGGVAAETRTSGGVALFRGRSDSVGLSRGHRRCGSENKPPAGMLTGCRAPPSLQTSNLPIQLGGLLESPMDAATPPSVERFASWNNA